MSELGFYESNFVPLRAVELIHINLAERNLRFSQLLINVHKLPISSFGLKYALDKAIIFCPQEIISAKFIFCIANSIRFSVMYPEFEKVGSGVPMVFEKGVHIMKYGFNDICRLLFV